MGVLLQSYLETDMEGASPHPCGGFFASRLINKAFGCRYVLHTYPNRTRVLYLLHQSSQEAFLGEESLCR